MVLTAGFKKVVVFLEMIKFEHSIFALPFAYLGMVLAAQGLPSLKIFLLATMAMVAGRTFGMSLNRLADREIDARNPRTQARALPQGLLSGSFVWAAITVSALVFFVSVLFLPHICLYLSPIPLFAMVLYPFLKRFTWWSHVFLGLILAMAPMGGWLAVRGSFALIPLLISAAVLFWVSGFDILYALADYRFDLKEKLHSLPARWGRRNAIFVSRVLHLLTLLCLAEVLVLNRSGVWAWTGFVMIAAIIIREHRILADHGLRKLETAFFTSNAWIGVIFFLGIFLDLMS